MGWPVRLRIASTPARLGDARTVEVPDGATLLDAVLAAGLPLARACSGSGLCGRCGLEVLAGGGALSAEAPDEAEAKRRNRVPGELRLACCSRVAGPVEVTASYW